MKSLPSRTIPCWRTKGKNSNPAKWTTLLASDAGSSCPQLSEDLRVDPELGSAGLGASEALSAESSPVLTGVIH